MDDKSNPRVRSAMEWLTFTITRLLYDPVCHPADWENVRPWPRPLAAVRGPDGVDDRPPVEEQARKKKCFSPLKAGAFLFTRD